MDENCPGAIHHHHRQSVADSKSGYYKGICEPVCKECQRRIGIRRVNANQEGRWDKISPLQRHTDHSEMMTHEGGSLPRIHHGSEAFQVTAVASQNWSGAPPTLGMPGTFAPPTSASIAAIMTDTVTCTTSRTDRKSTRLNSSHSGESRMPSSA